MRISRAVLAGALGVTERAVSRWETDLGLRAVRAPSRAAEYELAPLLRWLFDQGQGQSPLMAARVRDLETRTRIREAELGALERRLIPIEVILADDEERLAIIRAEILRMPALCAEIVNPADPNAGEDALEKVSDALLARLRDAFLNR